MEEELKSTDIEKIETEKLIEMYTEINSFVKYLEKESNKTTEE